MSQTSYQAALPHDVRCILYRMRGNLSRLFDEIAGGEFDGLVVAIDEVWGAG